MSDLTPGEREAIREYHNNRPQAPQPAPRSPVNAALDERAEIGRLATLNPLQYDRERTAAAENLGVKVGALDQAVKEARRENAGTKGQGRAFELPTIEPWADKVDGAELLSATADAIRRYVVFPVNSAETVALWALHTHCFNSFGHSPRASITSPEKQCGKSTLLDVLECLVARPLPTGNATVSSIFRIIELASPTLLIDEADTFLKENDELRGILNTGHKRGGQILRTVGDDHEPRQFSTWAPTAIAMIGRLPDTLNDRSVVIGLRRRKPEETVRPFRSDRADDLRVLARKMARWAQDHAAALSAADPDMGQLMNRVADNWRPLFAIADAAGGRWRKHARTIAQAAEAQKDDQSIRAMLLADIRDLCSTRPAEDRISSAELAILLGCMDDRPWSEWGRSQKPITASALARLLSPFGILTGARRKGGDVFRGYLFSDFEEAFASYIPDTPPQSVTPLQSNENNHLGQNQIVTHEETVTLLKSQKPNNHGHCNDVTLSRGVSGEKGRGTVRCAHCGSPGELVECGSDGVVAHLHRACIDAWQALTIPPQFDRRGELSTKGAENGS